MSHQSVNDSQHSVSIFLSDLRAGDPLAAQAIWERYYRQLITLSVNKLRSSSRTVVDENDVVQLVFSQFFVQVQQGRFPKLNDRDDLWQILAMLVDRRAKDQIRRQNTLRAGAGIVVNESELGETDNKRSILTTVSSREPTPAEAIEFAETLNKNLAVLRTSDLKRIALLKLQGYTNREIANKTRSSLRTVERMLNRIRTYWQ